MPHHLEFVETIPEDYRALLIAYLTDVLPTLEIVSGIKIDAVEMADATLADPTALLHPKIDCSLPITRLARSSAAAVCAASAPTLPK